MMPRFNIADPQPGAWIQGDTYPKEYLGQGKLTIGVCHARWYPL